MKTYRVYFADGNQRLYGADYEQEIIDYMFDDPDYNENDILRIEEV